MTILEELDIGIDSGVDLADLLDKLNHLVYTFLRGLRRLYPTDTIRIYAHDWGDYQDYGIWILPSAITPRNPEDWEEIEDEYDDAVGNLFDAIVHEKPGEGDYSDFMWYVAGMPDTQE